MNRQRIDEIREKTEDARTGHRLFDAGAAMDFVTYSLDLLDALEEVRAENERLKKLLPHYGKQHIFYDEVSKGWVCKSCRFTQGSAIENHHDNCPFVILEKARE